MMQSQKFWLIGSIALIAIAFSITIFALSTVAKPIGSDFYFHLHMATLISQGNISGAWAFPIEQNFFPYGFLAFHFLLSGLVLVGNTYFWAKLIEAILMPLTFTFTLYLIVKKVSAKAAFFTGLCLLGSIAFLDGTIQLRPESLDILLYPLMLLAVLSVKKKTFVGLALVTIYSHSFAALSNILGVALKLLREQKWRKTILAGLLLILPIVIVSFYYVQGAFHKWFTLAGANQSNLQQTLFWTQPLIFIPFYSGLTLFGFVFLLKRHKNYFETLLCYGILGSMIMIPFWADRWLQYITIPLSCLVGLGLKDVSKTKLLVATLILVSISFIYIYYWLNISYYHQWWQPT